MPSKKQSDNKRKKFTDWKSTQWVLNNLEPEHLADMDEKQDVEDLGRFFDTCVSHGLSIKIDWDDYSSCFKITATGLWFGFANTGMATQARSSEMADALKILWYKLEVLCEYDLSQYRTESKKREIRG